MVDRVRAVVIGGGVVGCAVLRELARHRIEALLVEAEPDLGEGASKANSAIVHTGFDAHAGTLEARLIRRASQLWPDVVDELGVPFLAVGALMLARTIEERQRLVSEVQANATALRVETTLLERDQCLEIAPYLHDEVVAALSIPDESVVDPFWLTRAYAEAAVVGGSASTRTNARVTGLDLRADDVEIRLEDHSRILAEQVFDCAGLAADDIARLAGDDSFDITPRKGEFLVSKETFGVDRIVLPIPGPMGKGMLVTPTVFGGLLLGPTAVDQTDKADCSTNSIARDRILAACRLMVPAVDMMRSIRSFAGLRPVSSTGAYVLQPSTAGDRLFIVAGIRSTGVTGSPAIAEYVVERALALRGWPCSTARRTLSPPPTAELAPGEIVCVCRSVSRGEVLAACRRPTAPMTIDALKRRSGVTFGDCQGNLCVVGTAAILAGERDVPLVAVEKGRRGSWLFEQANVRPRIATGGAAAGLAEGGVGPDTTYDVIIVGGGRSGSTAAQATLHAGWSTLVVERGRGQTTVPDRGGLTNTTVVGLVRDQGGWLVLGRGAARTMEIRARAVVLATGGFIEPAEHRGLTGPRPSGVITADLAAIALGIGLLPGRRVVVVGTGRSAKDLAATLAAAGAEIIDQLADAPDAIRGDRRLEAVHVDERWIECDTLILADRLLPGPFLLRDLGLIDGRPGIAAPTDVDGRLPLPGLWAVGCCANPDVDHGGCTADGRRVGRAVAEALRLDPW